MAKNEDGLSDSQEIRAYIISTFGFIPSSIMKADWSVRVERAGNKTALDVRKEGPYWGTRFSISDASREHQGDFPHNICRFFLKYLCPEVSENSFFNNGLASVFDPFAGHDSRLSDVSIMGRNYVGYDICHKYMENNRRIATSLTSNKLMDKIPQIELNECDSRFIDTEKYAEKFDFSITSPPFWKAESYGPESGQLFNVGTYEQFMSILGGIFQSCWKTLKDNSFMVVEVNDLRLGTIFYPFHADTIKQLQLAGFSMHDLIICDFGNSFQQIFCSELLRSKTVAKRHSYFLVAQKHIGKTPVFTGQKRKELLELAKEMPKLENINPQSSLF